MKYIICSIFIAFPFTMCYAQWQKLIEVDSHSVSVVLFDESIPNPEFGIAIFVRTNILESRVYSTSTQGNSWQQGTPFQFYSQFKSIAIKDNRNAWIFGGGGSVTSVYKTTDFGANWNPLPPFSGTIAASYYNVSTKLLFANEDNFSQSKRYVSNDEGLSWNGIQNLTLNEFKTGFAFCNKLIGIEGGGDNILNSTNYNRTSDGGLTWQPTVVVDESWQPLGIKNTSTFFIASEITENVLRSDDAGLTWDTIYHFPSNMYLSGCIAGNLCHLYIQTNGDGLWESTDEGKTWFRTADYNGYRDTRFYFYNNVLFVGDTPESSIKKPGALWRLTLPPVKPLVAFEALSMNTTLCSPADTIISYFAVNNCDGDKVVLDTLYTTGSPNFTITHDSLGREIVWDTLRVQYEPTDASEDTAFVHFRFRLKGNTFDTVMTIRGKGSSTKDSISFIATLTKPSVTWEETTELRVTPDKAAVNKNLSEIRFDVTLDADVLEPLTNYSTGIGGASIQMNPSTQVGKLTRYPFVITGNNMTLDPAVSILRLPMRPYVSDTTITTIQLSTIHLNPQDPDYERCTLSATGDGTPFTLELMCGDSTLSRYLGGKPILTVISLKPNPTKADVTVTFDLATSGTVTAEVFDVLGNVVKAETLEAQQGQTKYTITMADSPEGVYYVRLRSAGETRTVKFVRE